MIARLRRAATIWVAMGAMAPFSPALATGSPAIDSLRHIGPALFACWRTPGEVGDFEVRVRLSFRRDGSVIGRPRVVFSRFLGGEAEQRIIVRAIADALAACTPVRFSPSLGGAVAGRIFTFRFAPPSRRASLTEPHSGRPGGSTSSAEERARRTVAQTSSMLVAIPEASNGMASGCMSSTILDEARPSPERRDRLPKSAVRIAVEQPNAKERHEPKLLET